MYILLSLLIAFSVEAQIIPSDWSLETFSSFNSKPKKEFESIGVYKLSTLDAALTPHGGFGKLYKRFQNEAPMTIRSGVWQEAQAFRDWLASCDLGLSVSTESLALHLGLKTVFDSPTEADALRVLEELGSHLDSDRKIELAALMGGVFASHYDYKRLGGGKGIVSFTDLLKAAQTNTDAGVCRDMAQAQAKALKAMGMDQCYVTSYQTRGGGHAVVLCQDPQNKDKVHTINYNFITKTETKDALGHFEMNSTIPNTGVEVKVYNNEGKPISSIPTNLGVLLYEMSGGNPKDLDPMLKSRNSIIGVSLLNKKMTSIHAGIGFSPDGDKLMAMSVGMKTGSTYLPSRVNVTVYSNERETHIYGNMKNQGVYVNLEQRVQSKKIIIQSEAGEFSFRPYLSGGVQMNIARTAFNETSGGPKFGANSSQRLGAGVEGQYTSHNGSTRVIGYIEARADYIKADVRDEKSYTLSPNMIIGDVSAEHKVSDRVSLIGNGTVVARKEFGVQSRQEVGVAVYGPKDTVIAATLGHEGQVAGSAPVFVPGSRERYYADVSIAKNDKYRLSGGGWCDKSLKDCGVRATATVKLGPKKK
jgi:hypothetical protein